MKTKLVINITILLITAINLFFPELALATEIKKPSFVDDNGTEKLEEAGASIMNYVAVGFGVAAGLASAIVSFLAIRGKMEEMWEKAGNIIIGVIVFLVMGTVVFSII
jgi:hypothetical protein